MMMMMMMVVVMDGGDHEDDDPSCGEGMIQYFCYFSSRVYPLSENRNTNCLILPKREYIPEQQQTTQPRFIFSLYSLHIFSLSP